MCSHFSFKYNDEQMWFLRAVLLALHRVRSLVALRFAFCSFAAQRDFGLDGSDCQSVTLQRRCHEVRMLHYSMSRPGTRYAKFARSEVFRSGFKAQADERYTRCPSLICRVFPMVGRCSGSTLHSIQSTGPRRSGVLTAKAALFFVFLSLSSMSSSHSAAHPEAEYNDEQVLQAAWQRLHAAKSAALDLKYVEQHLFPRPESPLSAHALKQLLKCAQQVVGLFVGPNSYLAPSGHQDFALDAQHHLTYFQYRLNNVIEGTSHELESHVIHDAATYLGVGTGAGAMTADKPYLKVRVTP